MESPHGTLLRLLRARFDPGARRVVEAELPALGEPGEVSLLLHARRLEVTPLAAREIISYPGVSPDLHRRANAIYAENLARNLYLKSETARWVETLARAGVRALPIKGVFPSEWIHGDLGAKACADIDVLVPPSDAPAALDVLRAEGLVPRGLGPGWIDDRWCMAHPMVPAEGALAYGLDVHVRLWEPPTPALDEGDLWEGIPLRPGATALELHRAIPAGFYGALLCTHLWRHAFTLKTVADFAAFAVRAPEAMPDVAARLRRGGMMDAVAIALSITERVLGVRVVPPAGGARQRAGRRLSGFKGMVAPLLAKGVGYSLLERGPYLKYLVLPLMYDRARYGVSHALARLFRPATPSAATPVLRLHRFGRALGRFLVARGRFLDHRRSQGRVG